MVVEGVGVWSVPSAQPLALPDTNRSTESDIMNYYDDENNIILTDIPDFDLAQTLECGQCFHFVRLDDGERSGFSDYVLAAFDKVLRISQEGDKFTFYDTSKKDFENIWIPYFDLERDYGKIKAQIVEKNPELADVVKENAGIRLLDQDFFETLISFIISQNNRIPQIKKVVADISAEWGYGKCDVDGEILYTFPDAPALANVSEDELRAKKTGFRAAYICDAVARFNSGELEERELREADLAECEQRLCVVKGVGTKVANCVMLFSLGKRDAFPIDVWMKRVLEHVYFGGEEKDKSFLACFARDRYGELGGYAQQYLFAYARENLK